MTLKGVILNKATRRAGQGGLSAVYEGVLSSGTPFSAVKTSLTCKVWLDESSDGWLRSVFKVVPRPTNLTNPYGGKLVCVEFADPAGANGLEKSAQEAGHRTYEQDVPPHERFLIDTGILSGVALTGDFVNVGGVAVFDNPAMEPAEVDVQLSMLSFDLETTSLDPEAGEVIAYSMYMDGAVDEVHAVSCGKRIDGADWHADERSLLKSFLSRIKKIDPDVITGWNISKFDMPFIAKRLSHHNLPFDIGRQGGSVWIQPSSGGYQKDDRHQPVITLRGRAVLDGIYLLKGAAVALPDYSLETAASVILGTGKVKLADSKVSKADAIMAAYKNDPETFVQYVRTDADIPVKILNKLGIIELNLAKCALTGVQMRDAAKPVRIIDSVYLRETVKRNMRMPTQRDRNLSPYKGGDQLDPKPGVYENVMVFDYKSLYPNVIRTFNIDPMTFVHKPDPEADHIWVRIDDTKLVAYSRDRDRGVLPGVIDNLMPQREQAKRDGDHVASLAIKILMNSIYGALGNEKCRFYNPLFAGAITALARQILHWTGGWFTEHGFEVLYGDTDSVFVLSEFDLDMTENLASTIGQTANAAMREYVKNEWGVDSTLDLEYEKTFSRLRVTNLKKTYSGQLSGSDEVVHVGGASVRRDRSGIVKGVYHDLMSALFSGKSMSDVRVDATEIVRAALRSIEDGSALANDMLHYRRRFNKDPESGYKGKSKFTDFAKKYGLKRGDDGVFVETVNGLEAAHEVKSDVDTKFYMNAVKTVAEPLIQDMGLDYNQITGA